MNESDKMLRDKLLDMEKPNTDYKEKYERQVKAMFEKKLTGVRKLSHVGGLILGLFFLLIAAEGIVRAASFFSESLNLSLALVGILIVGVGNAIPETYFAILAAKRAQNWMILGDLMGSVIVAATLVLGIVALICPIEIPDFSPFAMELS